jgi:dCMP deaminase
MTSPDPVLVLYLPVIHAGYLKIFRELADRVRTVYVLGQDLIDEFTGLHAEIRALEPDVAGDLLANTHLFREVRVLHRADIPVLHGLAIITPRDTLTAGLVEVYLAGERIEVVDPFLRWDETAVNATAVPEADRVSSDPVDIGFMHEAAGVSKTSTCWWRHVGAVLVDPRGATPHGVMRAANRHLPSEHQPYLDGDPRDVIPAGINSELATTLHSEQLIVAEAARRGLSTEGLDLYVTVFPCPVCAKLVAQAGIRQLFFAGGHATLDGVRVLRTAGVRLIQVQTAS